MASLNDNNPITTGGAYEINGLAPGGDYLIALKSSGAFTAVLEFWDHAAAVYRGVDDGSFPDSGGSTEKLFIAPSQRMQLTVDSISTPVSVTLVKVTH